MAFRILPVPWNDTLVEIVRTGTTTFKKFLESIKKTVDEHTGLTAAFHGIAALLDEDDMASDSADSVATQQSIKAYVDDSVGASIGLYNDVHVATGSSNVFTLAGTPIGGDVTNIAAFRNGGLDVPTTNYTYDSDAGQVTMIGDTIAVDGVVLFMYSVLNGPLFVDVFTTDGLTNDFTLSGALQGGTVYNLMSFYEGGLNIPETDYTYNNGTGKATLTGATKDAGKTVIFIYGVTL